MKKNKGDYFSLEVLADILSLPKRSIESRIKKGELVPCPNTGLINKEQVMHFPEIKRLNESSWDDELKIVHKREYKLVELFAGAGGLALGMEQAGFHSVFVNELDKHACSTLRINRPNWNVKEGDISTDIEQLGLQLSERFNQFCKEYGKDITLMFEPGKFLVSEAGVFLAKVNVVKQTTSTVFAHVDSGFNHLVRPMMYNSHHHITNISNPEGRDRYYSVVGYICETDTFGSNRRIAEISEEDILCFHNAGAYCYSMASNYNSRYLPAEVMLVDGKDYLIRKRQTIQDILNNQEVVDFSKKSSKKEEASA